MYVIGIKITNLAFHVQVHMLQLRFLLNFNCYLIGYCVLNEALTFTVLSMLLSFRTHIKVWYVLGNFEEI